MVYLSSFKFSKLANGENAHLYRFDNGNMTVDITDFGAAIVAVVMPDKNGKLADIVLGFADASGYESQSAYMGVVAGRYANRINGGKFALNGNDFQLAKNDGENHLHGGNIGFSKRLWQASIVGEKHNPKLLLTLVSDDMDEGYPGKLTVNVTYYLDEENKLHIEYNAESDKDTIINLTNHSYFNLNGHNKGDILRHKLYVNADKIVRINENSIPTGELVPTENTPFDFTNSDEMHTIGERISQENQDLQCGCGYDHSFVLNNDENADLVHAATLREDYTGRNVLVYTNQPAVQIYTGNFLDKTHIGKQKHAYGRRCGVCMETQCYPDSPNHADFPSCVLKSGEAYNKTTIFEFKCDELPQLADEETQD